MVRGSTGRRSGPERLLKLAACTSGIVVALLGAVAETQDANADGDTRTLTFYHTHRGDSASITFRRNGRYDEQALAELNWYLRDWRNDKAARMDPHLFDVIWEVYRESGSHEPINIISSYRSPSTNAMLHRRSKAVAEHSQHMLGKAMDIRLPDVGTERLRAIAMKLQYGGVGYYEHDGFVHVDTGNVRAWPRMSREQLVRLFPDGKTVHLPSDGRPLSGYQEAKADILPRNAALEAQASGLSTGKILTALYGKAQPVPSAQPEEASAAAPPRTALAYAPMPPRRPDDLLTTAEIEPPPLPPEADRPLTTASLAPERRSGSIEPILGPDRKASVRAMFDPRTAFLDLGFSVLRESELSTRSFSGPAVKPLPLKQPAPVRQASVVANSGS